MAQWNYFARPDLSSRAAAGTNERRAKGCAWDLLATLFSPVESRRPANVMTLQDVLAASGNGHRRALVAAIFVRRLRTPSETGAWGFRSKGINLTQSIAVRDNRIVAVTPSSFSALRTASRRASTRV